MKPEIDLSEVLRRKFKDVDTAFCELQASSSSTAHFHCLTTETVPVFPRYTLPPLRTLQHQPV
uniref:Uncharacterized protein n=1 Tax=Tetraselmis sp. GSL018 TaxID=582737 RepID=A0A061RXA1_9CHLO